jgi:gliding motility-associated-like protein
MKTFRLTLLLLVFSVIFSTGKAQNQKTESSINKEKFKEQWMEGMRFGSAANSIHTNTTAKTYSGTGCPSAILTMHAQDSTNFKKGTTTYMNNNVTVSCTLPFYIFPNIPNNANPNANTDIVAPCIDFHYNVYNSNISTNGEVTVYQNGVKGYTYCNTGCNSNVDPTGTGPATLDDYLYSIDSSKTKTLQFCKLGTVGPTTITMQNCWDGTTLAGPVLWNAASPACFTLTIPPTANIGSAFYTTSPSLPTNGSSGIQDLHNGRAYIDPSQMPAGTYTVTYHFTGPSACPTSTGTYIFTVPAKPTISIAQSGTTTCSGSVSSFTASGAGTGGTYTWSPGNAHTTTLTVTNSPTVSTTYTYAVVATATTGCYASNTATVTVNPLPTLTLTSSPTTSVCLGSAETFTAAGANTYTWTSSANGGLGSTSGSTVTATPTTTATATYTVNATDGNGCKNSQALTINVIPLPTLTLTATSTTVCSSSSATLTASGNSTSYIWTSSAGGGLSSTSGSSVTAMPTISPATYTVVGSNATGCSSIAKTTSLTIITTPTISISSATYTTCLNAPVTFSVSGANSYNWSPTSNMAGSTTGTPTVTPSSTATVVYNVTGISNACASIASTVTLTVNPLPVLTVATPSTYTICNGGSQTFTVTGASSYTWTPSATLTGANTANPVASPIITTVYNVIGTDANNCSSVASPATTTVNVIPPPTLTLTVNSFTICQGSSQTFTASGAGNYSWAPPATILTGSNTATPTANPTTTTVYTLTAQTSGCAPNAPLTVTLTVNPAPSTPTLTNSTLNPLTECNGTNPDTVLVLNPVGATNVPVWYLNNTVVDTGLTYAPSTAVPGTYTYTVLDSAKATGCTSANAGNVLTVTVTILPPPTAPTLSNTTLNPLKECQGTNPDTMLVLNAVGANTVPYWYLGPTLVATGFTFSPPTNKAGVFNYIVSDSSKVTGCTNIKAGNALTVTVTILAPPTAPTLTNTTLNPLTECQGTNPDTMLVLNAVGANTIPLWYLGPNLVATGLTFSPPANKAGVFNYTVSDSSKVTGCTNIKAGDALTVTVTINGPPTAPTLTNSTLNPLTECQGTHPDTTLALTNLGPNIVPSWYLGSALQTTGLTFSPGTDSAGVFHYTVSDSSKVTGCTNIKAGNALTVTVTIVAPPGPPTLLSALSDTLLKECQGSPAQTLSVTTTASATPVWYIGTSTVTAANGYTFTPGTATPTTTIYNVANTSSSTGCSSALIGDVLTVTVTINSLPNINVSSATKDSSKCGLADGGITGLTPSDITGGLPPFLYQWYNGSTPIPGATSLVLNNVSNGTYSLQVTDANGCMVNGSGGTTTFTVPLITKPKAAFSTNPSGPVAASVPLTVSFDNQSIGATTYTWTFGEGPGSNLMNPPNVIYTNVNTYTVMLIVANNGCSDTTTATITAEVATTIIIPNIFSPNGDGVNDMFFIPNTGMTSLNCEIFNRWGQLLYTLNSPNQAWDGKAPDGNKAPDGTYMYLLQAEGLNGKTYKQQGTLTLIR